MQISPIPMKVWRQLITNIQKIKKYYSLTEHITTMLKLPRSQSSFYLDYWYVNITVCYQYIIIECVYMRLCIHISVTK